MANYTWKILDVFATDELITGARYYVKAYIDDLSVETEGYWTFSDQIVKVPFSDVTEQMIAQWIENESIQDGVSVIKSNLDKQLAYLGSQKPTIPPWKPQVFTPNI